MGIPESVPSDASVRPGGTEPFVAYHWSSPGEQIGTSSPWNLME